MDKFYQVLHRSRSVGFFREESNAKKYAGEFQTEIQGYPYPIEIRELFFLDDDLDDDLEDNNKDDSSMNWDAWLNENDTTSENGGV